MTFWNVRPEPDAIPVPVRMHSDDAEVSVAMLASMFPDYIYYYSKEPLGGLTDWRDERISKGDVIYLLESLIETIKER